MIRAIRQEEKEHYNRVVNHPLQSWEWGEFRINTGLTVERVGFFTNGELTKGLQVTFHPIPLIGKTAGYLPRSFMPDEEQLAVLKQLAKKNNALFIKMEPNIAQPVDTPSAQGQISQFLEDNGAVPGRPLFTKYTFQIDLTKTEQEMFETLESKTRYNVRLASKKGVTIKEDSTPEGMEIYLKILTATTKRQQFYAHQPDYFRKMWQIFESTNTMRIFHAFYEGKPIVSWIVFVFNGVLYYPYGASLAENRDVMASNLMMWEMMLFGKNQNCHTFDLWGSLGPNPKKGHPWYGFHRFKKGYGGQLVEFLGTFDLVINKPIYRVFRLAENLRWRVLRLKAKIRS